MNIWMRALIRDIAIYGTGDILLKATVFITMPIYTRIFSLGDYGIWSFVVTATGLLASVLILGGDSAYTRFFFESKSLEEKQVVTSTWFGFLAVWSGGMVLLSLPFAGHLSSWSFGTDKYAVLFTLALLAVPISLINSMCGQVLRNQFQARLFTTLNILSTILSVGFGLFGVLILDLGLIGILAGALLGACFMLPVRLWTARAMLRPVFSVRLFRNMLAFGAPLVPTSLAYWIFVSSDRIVLGKLSTLDQLGLYSIATAITGVLALVNGALGQAWSPHAVRVYEEDRKEAQLFFGQVMTYILVGFGIVCVGITTFAQEILMMLSVPAFYPAAIAVGPLSLGFMAYASTQITASGISLTKRTKYFAFFSWVAALLNLGLNVLFVPRWGMIAASWTTAVSYIFLTVAYLITSQRLWPVIYEKRRALTAVGLTFGFTLVAPLLSGLTSAFSLGLKSVYVLGYLGLLFTLGVLGKQEWLAICSLLRRRTALTGTGGAGEPG